MYTYMVSRATKTVLGRSSVDSFSVATGPPGTGGTGPPAVEIHARMPITNG
jgi:hypothetical protein